MTDKKQVVSSVRMIASRVFGLVRLSAISPKLKHDVEYGRAIFHKANPNYLIKGFV